MSGAVTDVRIGEIPGRTNRALHGSNDTIVNGPSTPNENARMSALDNTNNDAPGQGFEDVFGIFSDNAMACDNVEVPDFSGWDFDSFDGEGADGEEHH